MTARIKTKIRARTFGLTAAVAAVACGAATGSTSSAPSSTASAPAASATGVASAKFMTATSSKSFSATVSALKSNVSGNGMMVLGTLDQAKALSMTGLSLPGAESFFVGNSTTGKKLFSADPAIGTVVPLRMYVWQGSSGKAEVGYFDPAPLFSAVNPKLAAGGKKFATMAAKIARWALLDRRARTWCAIQHRVGSDDGSGVGAHRPASVAGNPTGYVVTRVGKVTPC